jgi:hypothetical protein
MPSIEEAPVTAQAQSFQATIVLSGGKTVLLLAFDPNEVWGLKERHHITGTINGHPVRGPLDADERGYFLTLGPAWRRSCGIEAGTHVDVTLAPEGPQAGTIGPDVFDALLAEPEAKAFFESLATFYRKNYIRWIESAKRPETRAARIAEMVGLLKAGKRER